MTSFIIFGSLTSFFTNSCWGFESHSAAVVRRCNIIRGAEKHYWQVVVIDNGSTSLNSVIDDGFTSGYLKKKKIIKEVCHIVWLFTCIYLWGWVWDTNIPLYLYQGTSGSKGGLKTSIKLPTNPHILLGTGCGNETIIPYFCIQDAQRGKPWLSPLVRYHINVESHVAWYSSGKGAIPSLPPLSWPPRLYA